MRNNKYILILLASLLSAGINAVLSQENAKQKTVTNLKSKKMKVEIWSDVMCPFCYIGKRKFEEALAGFEGKENVEVEWKSFQLNPAMKTDTTKSTVQYLAESKGWTMEYTKSAIDHVIQMARGVGLEYNFDKAVVANSFDAHRLIQFAKTRGKGDAAEERLFRAYFTEGKNTADHEVLLQLALEIGLDASETKKVLQSAAYSEEVNRDIREAGEIGVTGVPFFVIDRKYAVSGAQDAQHFLKTLQKAAKEQKTDSRHEHGASCAPDGKCE